MHDHHAHVLVIIWIFVPVPLHYTVPLSVILTSQSCLRWPAHWIILYQLSAKQWIHQNNSWITDQCIPDVQTRATEGIPLEFLWPPPCHERSSIPLVNHLSLSNNWKLIQKVIFPVISLNLNRLLDGWGITHGAPRNRMQNTLIVQCLLCSFVPVSTSVASNKCIKRKNSTMGGNHCARSQSARRPRTQTNYWNLVWPLCGPNEFLACKCCVINKPWLQSISTDWRLFLWGSQCTESNV